MTGPQPRGRRDPAAPGLHLRTFGPAELPATGDGQPAPPPAVPGGQERKWQWLRVHVLAARGAFGPGELLAGGRGDGTPGSGEGRAPHRVPRSTHLDGRQLGLAQLHTLCLVGIRFTEVHIEWWHWACFPFNKMP